MVIFLASLIAVSFVVILIFFYLSQSTQHQAGRATSLRAFLFSFWLIAVVMCQRQFYVLRIGGLVDLTIERIIFIFLGMSLLYGLFFSPHIRFESRTIEKLFFWFSLICIVSMGIHGFREKLPFKVSPWNIYITAYLFPFAAFLFAKEYLTSEKQLAVVMHTLFYLGVYLAIMAFFEFLNLRQYVFPRFINDPKVWLHLDRARGPFQNAAINGFALVIGFICGIHVLTSKHGFNRILHLAMLSLFFPAIFFTLTRSIYLCFLFVLAGILMAHRTGFSKKLLALPLSLILVFALLNASHLASKDRRSGGVYQVQEVQIRQSLLRRSTAMILDNPAFGVGLGQFIPASVAKYKGRFPIAGTSQEQTQHFQLIGLTVELGLVGVSLYLAILITFFRRFRTLFSRIPDTGFIGPNLVLVLGLGMGVFLLNNAFIDSSFHPFPNVIFFTFGGVIDGLCGQLHFMPAHGQRLAAVSVPTTFSTQGA